MAAHRKTRIGRKLGAVALFACLAGPAIAQTVPLPAPRPSAQPAVPAQALGARAQAPQQTTQAPNPVTNPFAALLGRATTAGVLTTDQRAIVERVNGYLSGVQTLTGNFIQVGPDGSRTQGDFYISKPGKVRFEYEAPSPIAIIADGSSLAVRDTKLATQDIYPLSQTPLRFLLSDRIDLLKDTNVVNVTADDVYISVTIEEKQALIGTSRLMLMVGVKDGQLKQWTVTDPQGYDTTVAVYNLDVTKKADPGLFKIDFTNYSIPPG